MESGSPRRQCKHCKKDFTHDNVYNMEKHESSCRKRRPPQNTLMTSFFTKSPSSSKQPKVAESSNPKPDDSQMCNVDASNDATSDDPSSSKQPEVAESLHTKPDGSEICDVDAYSDATGGDTSSSKQPQVVESLDTKADDSQMCDVDSYNIATKDTKYCEGLSLDSLNNFYKEYPFQIHSLEPYDFVPLDGSVYSKRCRDRNMRMSGESDVCRDCSNLEHNTKLKKIRERSQQPHNDVRYVNSVYLNFNQLQERLNMKTEAVNQEKLERLNSTRRMVHMQEQFETYRKVISLLATNDIPRLRQIIAVSVRQRRSASHIVTQLGRAIQGLYSPKGYTARDFDIAGMVLLVGGPRLLHILHQTSGLPSLTHTYRILSKEYKLHSMHLRVTCSSDVKQQLEDNLSAVMKGASENDCWSLKSDEISVEKRLRWMESTNEIAGLCINHTSKADALFNSEHTIQTIEDKLENNSIHLPTEACVFALSSIGVHSYHGRPILLIPICSHKTQCEQTTIFESVVKSWDNKYGTLLNIGSDGDGVRRQILNEFMYEELDSLSPLYKELGGLELLDHSVGRMQITVNFDPKHLAKRVRNNLISGGITIVDVSLSSTVLRPLMLKLGHTMPNINNLLDPKDKQNVPAAVMLLQIFADMDKWNTYNFTPGMVEMLPALSCLKVISYCILSFFARPTLSIEGVLVEASALAHMLLYLYLNNAKVVPTVLYHDLQATIKDIYFTAAKFKCKFPENPLYYYQIGSDQVEQLFASVRTQTHDRSCDVKQLEIRLHRAAVMDSIYSKNPEWRQKCNHLSTGPVDHTSPAHWSGDLKCGNLDFKSIWETGKHLTTSVLPSDVKTELSSKEKSVTTQKPFGKIIGVTKSSMEHSADAETQDNIENRDGFIQFEDNVVEGDQSQQNHNPTILVDGKPVYKSTILRLITNNAGCKKSGNRLRRVQGMSKFPGCTSHTDNTVNDTAFITVKDILGCKVITTNELVAGTSLCLFVCDNLRDERQNTKSFMEVGHIGNVSGRILRLNLSDEHYLWTPGHTSGTVAIELKYCRLVPSTLKVHDQSVSYYWTESYLSELFDEVPTSECNIDSSAIPYVNVSEAPICFSRLAQSVLPSAQSASTQNPDQFKCPVCPTPISKKAGRLHIGTHILNGELDDSVCGFCGSHDCSVDLKHTTHKSQIPVSNCNAFQKFSLKPAERSSQTSPCTNRPYRCPVCDVVYWTYHLSTHYRVKHSGQTSPYKISDDEKERLMKH